MSDLVFPAAPLGRVLGGPDIGSAYWGGALIIGIAGVSWTRLVGIPTETYWVATTPISALLGVAVGCATCHRVADDSR